MTKAAFKMRKFSSVLVLIFLALFILSFRKIDNYDIWWHLALGKQIVSTKQLTIYDTFSFTAGDQPFPASEWLFEIVVYLVQIASGIPGLVILKAFIAASTFLVAFIIALRYGSNIGIASFLLFFCYLVIQARLMMRPHLFTFLGIAGCLYILDKLYSREDWNSTWQIFSLIFFCAWVNFHPGVIHGLILAVAMLIQQFITKQSDNKDMILFSCLLFVVLLNPEGWNFIHYAQIHLNIYDLYGVREFAPPTLQSWPLFYVYVALFALSSIAMRKKRHLWQVLVSLLYCLVSFTTARTIPIFILVSFPLVALNMTDLVKRVLRSHKKRYVFFSVNSVVILSLIVISICRSSQQSFGIGVVEAKIPRAAVRFILKNNLTGPIYNSMEFGGYLDYFAYPELRVFVDGRNLIFFDLWDQIINGSFKDFGSMLERYNITLALTNYPENEKKISNYFIRSSDWHLVFWDDVSLVFLKNIPENYSLIKLNSYQCSPVSPQNCFEKTNSFEAVNELERAISQSRMNTKANDLLGLYYLRSGDYPKARERFHRSLRINLKDSNAYYFMAVTYRREDNKKAAIEFLKKCIRVNPNHARAVRDIGLLLRDSDKKKALKYLEKYIILNPNGQDKEKIQKTVSKMKLE